MNFRSCTLSALLGLLASVSLAQTGSNKPAATPTQTPSQPIIRDPAPLEPVPSTPSAPAPDQVVARVNGVGIKASELAPYLWDWLGTQVLQDIVTARLIEQEAAKQNVSVPEANVLKAYNDQLAQMRAGLPAGQDLDANLRQRGYSKSRLYMGVRINLLLNALAEKEFSPSNFVTVSTMLFRAKSQAAADVADAIKRADDARSKLLGGAKWQDLLTSTNQDLQMIQGQGNLGWRPLAVFPEPTQAEFKTMSAGQITKPVQTASGIQIFRLDMRGDQAGAEQLAQLKNQFVTMQRAAIVERLRQQGKVEILLGQGTAAAAGPRH